MKKEQGKNIYWDEAVEISLLALDAGYVTLDQLRTCLVARRKSRPSIGELAVLGKKLSVKQVFRILELQAHIDKPFGQIAIDKGFMNESDLAKILHNQTAVTPSLLSVLVDNRFVTPDQSDEIGLQLKRQLRNRAELSEAAFKLPK